MKTEKSVFAEAIKKNIKQDLLPLKPFLRQDLVGKELASFQTRVEELILSYDYFFRFLEQIKAVSSFRIVNCIELSSPRTDGNLFTLSWIESPGVCYNIFVLSNGSIGMSSVPVDLSFTFDEEREEKDNPRKGVLF